MPVLDEMTVSSVELLDKVCERERERVCVCMCMCVCIYVCVCVCVYMNSLIKCV